MLPDSCLRPNGSATKLFWFTDSAAFNPCFLILSVSITHSITFLIVLINLFTNRRSINNNSIQFESRPGLSLKLISLLPTVPCLALVLTSVAAVCLIQIEDAQPADDDLLIQLDVSYGCCALVWCILFVTHVIRRQNRAVIRSKWSLLISNFVIFLTYIMLVVQSRQDRRPVLYISIAVTALAVCYMLSLLSKHVYQSLGLIPEHQGDDTDSLISHETSASLPPGDDRASLCSSLLFCWTSQLLKRGYHQQLNSVSDLYSLPNRLNIDRLRADLQENLQNPQNNPEHSETRPTLVRALFRTFGLGYFLLGILKFLADNLNFVGPILLHELVEFMSDPTAPTRNGYIYAAAMCAASLASSLCSWHFNYGVELVAMKVRASVQTTLYSRVLCISLSTFAQNEFGSGELMNLMTTDIDRLVGFCPSFHGVWSMPVQLVVAIYLIYREVGLTFLVVIAIAVLLIPINKWITVKLGQLSTKMMTAKDKRVRLITELLFGIRPIVLSNWQSHFHERIQKLRSVELRYLKGRKYLDAVCVYLWASAPAVIAIAVFLTYALTGHTLTAAKVFTCLALINILIMPLNAFPWALNGIIEAWVSARRLQRFMDLPTLDTSNFVVLNDDQQLGVALVDCSSGWITSEPVLNQMTVHLNQGQILGITGAVGTGKTSLLLSLCNELHMNKGHIAFGAATDPERGTALCTQEPWLLHGTVRDNILFGKAYDAAWYNRVVSACAMKPDLEQMPNGDQSIVSEQGVTLSGGQRTRLALARAVYQDVQLYLLDDPLAAVDTVVGAHLWSECIIKLLRNRGKTVVIATHHSGYLKSADLVLKMCNDGETYQIGSPTNMLDAAVLSTGASSSGESSSTHNMVHEQDQNTETVLLADDEEKEVGSVALSVYVTYSRAVGICLSLIVVLSLTAMQVSQNVTDWWLSYWVSHANDTKSQQLDFIYPNQWLILSHMPHPYTLMLQGDHNTVTVNTSVHIDKYLIVYACLAAANTVFTLIRAFAFAYAGIVGATHLHDWLLRRMLAGQISFFDRTPVGRIVNRFSSDLYQVDETLPFQGNIFLMCVFKVIGTLTVMCYALPAFSIIVVCMAVLYYWIQRYFRYSNSELKRLCNISLSPVYTHLTDTITGMATIRAMRQSKRFHLMMIDLLTSNLRAQFSTLALSQWLSVRLQLLGVLAVTAVALLAVVEHTLLRRVDPGLVGLAISYGLSITAILNGLITSFTSTEKELVSVERISHYIKNIPTETDDGFETETNGNCRNAQVATESTSSIEFNDVSLRYGAHLPPALRSVSFKIKPGEKVAVVGRTGSGKSSLLQAVFRAYPIESGSVCIGTQDIHLMSVAELRCQLTIIPQQPILFTGTLRDNIDVCGSKSDEQVWDILKQCKLDVLTDRLGGLNGPIGERGSGLSLGERQLICLARALLRNTKIICIDEATAHVDLDTDQRMQHIIRTAFDQHTVICIAHRLATIQDYDKVIVMDNGRVKRICKPSDL